MSFKMNKKEKYATHFYLILWVVCTSVTTLKMNFVLVPCTHLMDCKCARALFLSSCLHSFLVLSLFLLISLFGWFFLSICALLTIQYVRLSLAFVSRIVSMFHYFYIVGLFSYILYSSLVRWCFHFFFFFVYKTLSRWANIKCMEISVCIVVTSQCTCQRNIIIVQI